MYVVRLCFVVFVKKLMRKGSTYFVPLLRKKTCAHDAPKKKSPYGDALPGDGKHRSFTATIGNVNQTKVEKLASFQQ